MNTKQLIKQITSLSNSKDYHQFSSIIEKWEQALLSKERPALIELGQKVREDQEDSYYDALDAHYERVAKRLEQSIQRQIDRVWDAYEEQAEYC